MAAGRRWQPLLRGIRQGHAYVIAVFALAALSAASGLYPFGPVLAAAIAVAPRRWRAIYAAACLGAVTGVLLLAWAVQVYGLPWVEGRFPGIEGSAKWQDYRAWTTRYGWLALALVAALPLPQIPILVLSALGRLPLPLIALAVLLGKLVKYGVYGAAVLGLLRAVRRR